MSMASAQSSSYGGDNKGDAISGSGMKPLTVGLIVAACVFAFWFFKPKKEK